MLLIRLLHSHLEHNLNCVIQAIFSEMMCEMLSFHEDQDFVDFVCSACILNGMCYLLEWAKASSWPGVESVQLIHLCAKLTERMHSWSAWVSGELGPTSLCPSTITRSGDCFLESSCYRVQLVSVLSSSCLSPCAFSNGESGQQSL